jgi:hypothetical protein
VWPGRLGGVSARASADIDWVRLWRLQKRIGPEGFEPIGLRLGDPARARAWVYQSTPTNVVTFASTGGNGVHFSLLDLGDDSDATPVVMTVPMAFDSPNHIVGGDLWEFLALGYWNGYFYLEQLAYRWGREKLIARLQGGPATDDPEEARPLRHLIAEFGLRPWPNVAQRLDELDALYRPHVQLRPAG